MYVRMLYWLLISRLTNWMPSFKCCLKLVVFRLHPYFAAIHVRMVKEKFDCECQTLLHLLGCATLSLVILKVQRLVLKEQ